MSNLNNCVIFYAQDKFVISLVTQDVRNLDALV